MTFHNASNIAKVNDNHLWKKKRTGKIACRQIYLIKNFAMTQKSVFLRENYTIYENSPHGIYR